MFKQINILPRWAIFIIDIFICILAFFLAYVIKGDMSFDVINKAIFLKNTLVLICVCAPVFLILKTYTGIVRLTTIQDAFKILIAVTLINGGFIAIYMVTTIFFHSSFISITTLVINGFIEFVLLLVYRLGIKYLFSYFRNPRIETKHIVVYGATDEGIATKRALEMDTRIYNRVIAFMDDDRYKTRLSVDGIPVFQSSDFELLLENEHVDEMIIASTSISAGKKNALVDICLDRNIKAMLTPPVKEWVNGQLSLRQIHDIRIEELLERAPIEIHNDIIENQVKGKRIMITGASGSIGSEIVKQLARFKPALMVLVDIAETPMYESELQFSEYKTETVFRYFIADVRNRRRMEQIFRECKPHYVYHAAAYKHVPLMEQHPYEAVATNVLGTKNVADLSLQYGVQKFVMISSDKSVNPTNVMGASKRIAEIYVQSLHNHHVAETKKSKDAGLATQTLTRFITTRFGNVLGSNGSVIPRFRIQIAQGGPVTVTHPDISRYFMTIPEACQLVLEAGSMGKGGEIFVFEMGKLVRIVDLANKMIRLAGLSPGVDIDIKYTGLRPGEKLHEELLTSDENTIATYHNQIMIAKVREYDYEQVRQVIDRIITLIENVADELEIVKLMKEIIPEYISNHSVFESLDKRASQ
ncbi:polysaccharide biosynthesis protein [Sediminibacterium roseum]|uniref:Polysaccharide biosynthesis protein n=1 Tax=Sediminibacterium roseum TaxID=1978412 RepID=A0ABW9ZQ65_9BACT|nr:nucleoside-diphosphate sugar epimerase/dehydratase [Sediminibacterium roseum]NCI49059.1 polysaccharide biosynthesis protein [Sediminibacterium roseum]